MRKLLPFLLFLWTLPAYGQLPTTIGWSQLTNTKIDDVCACTHGFSSVCGAEGCDAIESWSGGTFDTTRNRALVWGGGHNAYYGNEIYALNLDATPPTMTRLNDPYTGYTACNPNVGTQPLSRHTYDGQEYMPNVDRMFAFGGAMACSSGGFSSDTWTFGFSSMTWNRQSPTGTLPGVSGNTIITSAYDPNTGLIFAHDRLNLFSFNYSTNVWTRLTNNGTSIGIHQTATIDPVRKLYVIVGYDQEVTDGRVYSYDIQTGSSYTRVTRTTTGGDAFIDTQYPGIDYYSFKDRIVGWNGGNLVYTLNLDTNTWTTTNFSTNPGSASPTQGRGTHGRFRYSKKSGVFTLINGTANNAWVLRLDSAADTDFYNRCTAPGVVRCFDFDDTADFPTCGGGTGGCFGQNFGLMPPSGTSDYTRATRDTTTYASGSSAGSSSLKMIIPTNTGADVAGSWFTNFSSSLLTQFGANSTFYVSWRQRFDTALATTSFNKVGGGPQGGVKQVILVAGDKSGGPNFSSCEANHIVAETYVQSIPRFTTLYNSCTGCTSHVAYEHMYQYTGTTFLLQNAMPSPQCKYSDAGATGCSYWFANEWMTYKIRVDVGTRAGGTANEFSNVRTRMWIAREAQAFTLVVDFTDSTPASPPNQKLCAGPVSEDQKYGKIWLLPYMTEKDPAQSHTQGTTWYDELIISTSDIDAPGFPSSVTAGQPAPPTGFQRVP